MENNNFKEAWERNKAKLQDLYPHLSSDDVAYEAGKEEELLDRLQAKLGKTKKEIREWLSILG